MPLKTLILNGSPKAHGDTAALIDMPSSHLQGEVRVVSTGGSIGPCVDCRHCWTKPGCALQDVYLYLEECATLAPSGFPRSAGRCSA